MADVRLEPPADVDILAGRLPTAAPDLAGLDDRWQVWPDWKHGMWPDWKHGMWPALVRHLDGHPGDPTGRYVAVVPYLFTWAVICGQYATVLGWFDNRWCYHTRTAALAAAHIWDGQDEPVGWHRHPATDRRTLDGDMTRIFTDAGCPMCGTQLHEHRCSHRPACCPDRCPPPS